MADMVDKAESELSQIITRTNMSLARGTGRNLTRASVTVGKGVVAAPFKAVAALFTAIRDVVNPEQGKVSLKAFSRVVNGKRDLVQLNDQVVAREFERELRRHGVTWTVEQHKDGSRTFHVEGKDAELIQHALGIAAARIDAKIASGAPELREHLEEAERTAQMEQKVPSLNNSEPDRFDGYNTLVEHGHAPYQNKPGASQNYFVTIENNHGAQHTYWGVDLERALTESGAKIGDQISAENIGSVQITLPNGIETHRNTWSVEKEQATQLVQRISSDNQNLDSEHGEHQQHDSQRSDVLNEQTQQQESGSRHDSEQVLSRSDQRPEQTARDRTRAHCATRIERDVSARKEKLEQSKTHKKTHQPGRAAVDEASKTNSTHRR